MANHTHDHADLTKNQALVLDRLNHSDSPMSAYNILDELRSEGLKAPLQIYRALEKLIDLGLAHRLDSLNAFVACRSADCDSEKKSIFMICGTCGQTFEMADDAISKKMEELTKAHNFKMSAATIELRGTCQMCG